MTMKSVGLAAAEMVQEVERQFKADPSLLDPNSTSTPDYDACVEISTKASLREMIAPAALVMLTPLVAGTFFGVEAVFGILTGGLGLRCSVSYQHVQFRRRLGQREEVHQRRVRPRPALRKKDGNGNSTPGARTRPSRATRSRPGKDTSGPALNILMKLMAIRPWCSRSGRSIAAAKGLFKLPWRLNSIRRASSPPFLTAVVAYVLLSFGASHRRACGAGSQRGTPQRRRAEASRP